MSLSAAKKLSQTKATSLLLKLLAPLYWAPYKTMRTYFTFVKNEFSAPADSRQETENDMKHE